MNGLKEIVFPHSRLSTIDICALGRKKHHITALMEIDVTEARAFFRRHREQSGESLSFTAWVAHCVALAAGEYPQVAAYRSGRRKIVISDSIDVAIPVEKRANGYDVPLPMVIRDCGGKSVAAIHKEIRQAQAEQSDKNTVVLNNGKWQTGTALFYRLPAFMRRLIWKLWLLRPKTAKKTMGSVIVTALGMVGDGDGWFIPIGVHPLLIAVGSIVRKPGIVGDEVIPREYLKLTVCVDHDVVDGGPAARFIARLNELMISCSGLLK